MDVFSLDALKNSRVYKSALPKDKEKLEEAWHRDVEPLYRMPVELRRRLALELEKREQYEDMQELGITPPEPPHEVPAAQGGSERFTLTNPDEIFAFLNGGASAMAAEEARRAAGRHFGGRRFPEAGAIPETGWRDPINWVAGFMGGARAALWRAGHGAFNALTGAGTETLGQVLSTELVAEIASNLGQAFAEKLGTPAAGPGMAMLVMAGGHAGASQLYKGLRDLGYPEAVATKTASEIHKLVKGRPEEIQIAESIFYNTIDKKGLLDASYPWQRFDTEGGLKPKKTSMLEASKTIENVNQRVKAEEQLKTAVEQALNKYVSSDLKVEDAPVHDPSPDKPEPATLGLKRGDPGVSAVRPPKTDAQVKAETDKSIVTSGEYFPDGESFANTVRRMVEIQKMRDGDSSNIDTFAYMFASTRDAVADSKIGRAFPEKTKKKLRDIVGNFTKYEYGKDPELVTARDLSNNMSGRVIEDARNLVKRGRHLATKHGISHEDIDLLLRGKSTRTDLPPELVDISKALRKMIDGLGVDMVSHGLMKDTSRAAGEGSYLPRLYAIFEHPEYYDFDNAHKNLLEPAVKAYAERTGVSIDKAREYLGDILAHAQEGGRTGVYHMDWLSLKRSMMRNSLPEEVRILFGEITDPFYLAYRGIKDNAMDLQHALMFDYLSRNTNLYSPSEKPGWVKLEQSLDMSKMTSTVKDRYGKIAGGYVPRHVAEEITRQVKPLSDWQKAWRLHMGLWKKMMVPLSPRTVFRNIISDSMMKYIGGMPYYDQAAYMRQAWKEYTEGVYKGQKTDLFKLAERLGLFDGTFLESDVRIFEDTVRPESLYRGQAFPVEFPEGMDTENPVLQFLYLANRFVDRLGADAMGGLGLGEKASKFYSTWENASKYAMFKYFLENGRPMFRSEAAALRNSGILKGVPDLENTIRKLGGDRVSMTPEEAIDYVQRWMFDYSKLPKHLQTARNTTHPFIAYPYLAGRALSFAIQENPERVLYLLLQMLLITKALEAGLDLKVEVSDLMPYGHMWDGGDDGNPIPGAFRPLVPSGPAVLPLELLSGKSLHTGYDIGHPVGHLMKSNLPSILTYHGADLLNPPENETYMQTVLDSLFGVKTQRLPSDTEQSWKDKPEGKKKPKEK